MFLSSKYFCLFDFYWISEIFIKMLEGVDGSKSRALKFTNERK